MKGGAAVQLHLLVDMQRGSVDVDIICPFTEQQIAKTLSRIHSKIPFMHFEKYTPEQPAKGISMGTYLAKISPLTPSKSGCIREVKIDFLLENLKVPTQV